MKAGQKDSWKGSWKRDRTDGVSENVHWRVHCMGNTLNKTQAEKTVR